MDQHLEQNGLMEGQQRGAKSGCFGTMDNFLIDRAVMLDCQRGKRNLSMAWIDARKAFDSVDHDWLCAMMTYTGFPEVVSYHFPSVSSLWFPRKNFFLGANVM